MKKFNTVLNISSRSLLSVVNGKPETKSLFFSKLTAYFNLLFWPKSNDLSSFLETNRGRPSINVLSKLSAFVACSTVSKST